MVWADRIPQAPVADVVRGALGESTEGYLHQLYYNYPLRGGYAAIMDAWASGLDPSRLLLGETVERLVPGQDGITITTSRGEHRYDEVVSTLPLKHLVDIVPGVPPAVRDAVDQLVVNPMVVATFGFRGVDPHQFTAVYVADEEFLVNRISYPAVFSPHNAPEGCFSVQAEITTAPGSPVMEWTDEAVREHVLEGLASRGLIPSAEPIFEEIERFESAYVVYTQGFEDHLAVAERWFRSQGIHLHGRFGSHNYLNIDGCLLESIALARSLGVEIADEEVLATFSRLA